MLCPEVSNFPPPKVITSTKKFDDCEKVIETLKGNCFYSSMIITIPDELQIPTDIHECITEDTDYYKLRDCSLAELVEPIFIEKFVKNGTLYVLSAERNCMTQNCAAVTSDGILTIHLLENIFQTLGLEGTKRPHNFYEVRINLKDILKHKKLKQSLKRLEDFNLWITWEPNHDNVCPSSIAKYFHERNFHVTVHTLKIRKMNPDVCEIPSVKDVELDEMTEWIGMLAVEGNLSPTEPYISTYCQPDSAYSLKTARISVIIVKGFITSSKAGDVFRLLQSYVKSRELENYWVSLSMQTDSDSPWQFNNRCPRMFRAHYCTYNTFLTQDGASVYSISQLKYS